MVAWVDGVGLVVVVAWVDGVGRVAGVGLVFDGRRLSSRSCSSESSSRSALPDIPL